VRLTHVKLRLVTLLLCKCAVRMLIKKPFLGWGLGAFRLSTRNSATSIRVSVETGLVGFSVAIWFLVLVFRQAASKGPRPPAAP